MRNILSRFEPSVDSCQFRSSSAASCNLTLHLPSRRRVLTGAALVLGTGAALAASPAWAAKVSQVQAGYRSTPRGGNECDKCLQFQAPAACKVVDGVVSPAGSCNFFAPKPQ